MMTLFDDEQILEAYAEDIKNNEARKTAKKKCDYYVGKRANFSRRNTNFFPQVDNPMM